MPPREYVWVYEWCTQGEGYRGTVRSHEGRARAYTWWQCRNELFHSTYHNILVPEGTTEHWIVRKDLTQEVDGTLTGAKCFPSLDAAVAALALGFRL